MVKRIESGSAKDTGVEIQLTSIEIGSSVSSSVDSPPQRSCVSHVIPPSRVSSELNGSGPREVLDLRRAFGSVLVRRVDLLRIEGDGFRTREGICDRTRRSGLISRGSSTAL